MITNIQQDLEITLEKALDKTKLVQVQVTVQGKNGPFLRMQWKNPADVKSTDKVIGNQDVLDKYKKEQDKKHASQSTAKSNFNRMTFDNLKVDKDKRKDAMDYAKQSGITWNEHPNPNINWMRCCMAVNQLDSVVSVQPAKKLNIAGVSGSWDTLDKKSKMAELMKHNSRKELMDFAKEHGIIWKEDSAEGINWMRASMAIQKFIDEKSLLELNGDAKFPSKKKISDKLDIPSNATEREKNIIGLINKVNSEEDLKLFKSAGMIAEDDDAKEFIKTKLLARYNEWKNKNTASSNTNGRRTMKSGYASSFGKMSSEGLGSTVFKGIPKKLLAKGIASMKQTLSVPILVQPRWCLSPLSFFEQPYDVRKNTNSFTANTIIAELIANFSTYSEEPSDNEKLPLKNSPYNDN